MSFENSLLIMDFGIRTLEAAHLNIFISFSNSTIPLLAAPASIPVIDPPQYFAVPIPDFPDLGKIGILTTVTTEADGIICSDWETVDTYSNEKLL